MSSESFKFKTLSKTPTEQDDVEDTLQKIVNTLAGILERCLNPKQFQKIEALFTNSGSLAEVLKNIHIMSIKISEDSFRCSSFESKPQIQFQSNTSEENYLNLEKMVQKYEAEIRDHIRMEQQLGIYTQSLEEEIDNFKSAANSKAAYEKMSEQLSNYKAEIEKLKAEKSGLEVQLKKYAKAEFLNPNISALIKTRAKSIDKVM